jgi:hypothetical protein
MSTSRLFCAVFLLAACAEPPRDVTGIGDAPARLLSAQAAKSGGSAVYAYTLGGDISTTWRGDHGLGPYASQPTAR